MNQSAVQSSVLDILSAACSPTAIVDVSGVVHGVSSPAVVVKNDFDRVEAERVLREEKHSAISTEELSRKLSVAETSECSSGWF